MTTKIARTRVLNDQHPVSGLIDEAEGRAPREVPRDDAGSDRARPARLQSAPETAAPEATTDDHASSKQVNYRLDPVLVNLLKKASIVHSYRQGRQISQNKIVATAVQEWLDANGPWDL